MLVLWQLFFGLDLVGANINLLRSDLSRSTYLFRRKLISFAVGERKARSYCSMVTGEPQLMTVADHR